MLFQENTMTIQQDIYLCQVYVDLPREIAGDIAQQELAMLEVNFFAFCDWHFQCLRFLE